MIYISDSRCVHVAEIIREFADIRLFRHALQLLFPSLLYYCCHCCCCSCLSFWRNCCSYILPACRRSRTHTFLTFCRHLHKVCYCGAADHPIRQPIRISKQSPAAHAGHVCAIEMLYTGARHGRRWLAVKARSRMLRSWPMSNCCSSCCCIF